jgi:hypothetical protein
MSMRNTSFYSMHVTMFIDTLKALRKAKLDCPQLRKACAESSPATAFLFANLVICGPFPEGEALICSNQRIARFYAYDCLRLKGEESVRWVEANCKPLSAYS